MSCQCDYPREINCAVHKACNQKVAIIAEQRLNSAARLFLSLMTENVT